MFSMLRNASAVCALVFAALAWGQAAKPVDFDLPAQSLEASLKSVADRQKLQMVYVRSDLEGVSAPALRGHFTVEEAIAKLTQGTQLMVSFDGKDTVVIKPKAQRSSTNEALAGNEEKLRMVEAGASAQSTQGAEDRQETAKSAENAPGAKVEEIVVTAQKRSERLRDVPISISVLRGEDLDRATVDGITDALRNVPGVAANVAIQGGGTQLAMRGVAASGPLFFGSSPVAYYLDSVPFGFVKNTILPDASGYDLQRVEVLRGPQGTLYGANAQNGVVRVLTHDVDLNSVEFKSRVSGSSTEGGGGNYRGDAAINVPLIPGVLAARAVIGRQYSSGWLDKPNDARFNDADVGTYRLKVKAQPNENLSLGLSAWLSRSEYGGPSLSPDNKVRPPPLDEPIDSDFDAYSFTLDYEFANVSLSSATSYLDYRNHNFLEQTGTLTLETLLDADVLSEEIYLRSKGDGHWRWTAGGSYRDAEDRLYQQLVLLPAPFDWTNKSKAFAVFGELTRLFQDGRFELTAGLRYFEDEVSERENVPGTGVSTQPLYRIKSSFDALSPRLVLTWHANQDMTAYASYSEGFRSGLNQNASVARAAPGLGPVEADNLRNYELGAKASLFGGRLSIDSAVFYIDWQDVQQPITVTLPGNLNVAAVLNGTSASGAGFEVGARAQLLERLSLSVNYSWNDLHEDADVISGQSTLGVPVVLFPKGSRLNFSPKSTASASADYDFALGGSGYFGRFSVSASYLSEQYFRRLASGTVGVSMSDAMLIGRASLAFTSPGDRWTATLYSDNINNQQRSFMNNWLGRPDWDLRTRPRTIGLQLEYRL